MNARRSSLGFGAGAAGARDVFWDAERLRAEWSRPGRRFLVTAVDPGRSVIRALPEGAAHLVAASRGRWLYTNVADRNGTRR